MKVKLLLLLNFVVFVKSELHELSSAPKVCNPTINVGEGINYEKTLCYGRMHLSNTRGSRVCSDNNMQLYQANSSPLAWETLQSFGKKYLGGKQLAQVYVEGRNGGKCQLYSGAGVLTEDWCDLSYYFLCEFVEITYINCDSYDEEFSANRYVDPSGIEKPQTCMYKSAITSARTVLSVDNTVADSDVIAIDLSENELLEFLPIKLAEKFPRLNIIRAQECSIKELSKLSFDGLSSLRFIDLDDNLISTLLFDTISSLVNLERLDLDNNPITTISSNIFVELPKLHTVWLKAAGCIDAFVERSISKVNKLPDGVKNTCNVV